MKKLLSTIIVTAMSSITAIAAGDKTVDGLTYFLPKTAVRMQVLVEKTTVKPGQLADYSELYFKKTATTVPQTTYRIVGTNFSTVGTPDNERQFTVAIDKKHSVFSIDCTPDRVLKAINTKAPATAKPKAFKQSPKAAPLNPRDYMSQDILAAGFFHYSFVLNRSIVWFAREVVGCAKSESL